MERTFITVEEAQDAILGEVGTVGAERVMLTSATGRVLAETVLCPFDSPSFDNSAMDGIAIKHGQSEYALIGESAAGSPFDGQLDDGEAIRIMTGAMVPMGADTVVMRESCEFREDSVRVTEMPTVGANIRRRASSLAAGELVLDVGCQLRAGDIGLLAAFNRPTVSVSRRPKVAVITTGSELVDVGNELQKGQIVNSNAYMLQSLLVADGCEPWILPIVPDDKWQTQHAFDTAIAGADVVVSVGGVSIGDYDFVREVLDSRADGMEFWKIQMKPGKPLAFGKAGNGTPMLGLPGNPASSFVCYFHFVRPLLLMMQAVSRDEALLPRTEAVLQSDTRSTPKRRQFVTGTFRLGDKPEFTPYSDQSSGNIASISQVNALGSIPVGQSFMSAGDLIEVHLLPK